MVALNYRVKYMRNCLEDEDNILFKLCIYTYTYQVERHIPGTDVLSSFPSTLLSGFLIGDMRAVTSCECKKKLFMSTVYRVLYLTHEGKQSFQRNTSFLDIVNKLSHI